MSMSCPKSRGGPASLAGSELSLAGEPLVPAAFGTGSVGAASASEEVKLTRPKLRTERLRVMAMLRYFLEDSKTPLSTLHANALVGPLARDWGGFPGLG